MSPAKTVTLVLVALAVLGCLGAGAVSFVLWRVVGSFGPERSWNQTAVAERDVPRVFGVKLGGVALRYQARDLGFQDAYLEAVVRLPDGSAERFLQDNGLTRAAKEPADPETLEVLRELEPGTPPLEATPFELGRRVGADGGEQGLSRRAVLLEGDGGVTWLHLVAFGF